MLWVYSDRYGVGLAERRRIFKAMSFAPSLSEDGLRGTITLYPEITVLNVGSCAEDYNCIRIFTGDGRVIGTMRRSPAGEVSWHEPGRVDGV